MRSSKQWATLALTTTAASFLLPTTSATLLALPFILLSVYCVAQDKYFTKYHQWAWIYLLLSAIPTLALHGILETKGLFVFICCLCGISYMSTKFEFQPKMMYWFFICCVIPLGLYRQAVFGNVHWLPVEGMVNILGGESTKHGTAVVGVLLLFPTITYLFEKYKGIPVPIKTSKLYLWLILALYLVVGSSSRSVTLAVLFFLFFIFINRKGFRKGRSVALFIACNASVYIMEYLSNYVDVVNDFPILADFVHAENFEHDYGVTAGRSWLWGVHMTSFINSPFLLGGGRAVTDFRVLDWLPWLGEEAHAGSESPYTGWLACYGLIGAVLILIQIGMFAYAVRKRSTMAAALIFCMIYNTTMGESLTTPSTYDGILCYFLYFTCLQRSERYPQLR